MESHNRLRRHNRRKHCLACKELFSPDSRSKGKQQYCSKESCQTYRQRQNEYSWRINNPDCLAYQRDQSRQWHRARPQYSQQRRKKDSKLARRNVEFTRERMRRRRKNTLFDKSKSIFTQLIGSDTDKCYLSKGSGWVIARLTKASLLSKVDILRHNPRAICWKANRLPKGRLHDISAAF